MAQDAIKSAKYQGHQAPVLSLAISDDSSLLMSGSEDHTARLWDLRDNKKQACLCIQSYGEVLSVAFAPKKRHQDEFMPDSLFARDHSMYDILFGGTGFASPEQTHIKNPSLDMLLLFFCRYLSVENSVYEYDLRRVTSPIIQQPTRDLSPILQNQDEVNQISLAFHTPKPPKTKQKKSKIIPRPKLYLAASDDAGSLRFMETSSTTTSQVLKHDPNAVVPACAFRPPLLKGGSLEIASGGTDCTIKLWDAFKPK
jgi:WD40 repeat protein